MIDASLAGAAEGVASLLRARGETVAVAEGSCGGLISAALLAVPGASDYYVGGAVIYTGRASRELLAGVVQAPEGMRGATEEFARYLAESIAGRLRTTWGIGEGGAAGPAGNPYGDPAGHAWLAVAGPAPATHHVLTGEADRAANMVSFAREALALFATQLHAAP